MIRATIALLAGLGGCLAHAGDGDAPALGQTKRSKMPEPLIGESITDLDRVEAGELEVDLTTLVRGSSALGPGSWISSLEAEWGVTRRLGLAIEVGLAKSFSLDSTSTSVQPEVRLAASWALLHDLARDIHLQAEASQFFGESESQAIEPGESALPFAFGLRGGVRRGRWTVRAALGGAIGSGSAHRLPVRAELALFAEFGAGRSLGFAGVELDGDWARRDPLLLAPTFLIDGARFGLPFRLGVCTPLVVSRRGTPASILVRLIYEPEWD
jgi:hypothetical protein